MGSITLTPAPPLGGLDQAFGANRVVERHDLALVSLALPLGGVEAVSAKMRAAWDLAMPGPSITTQAGAWRAVSMTPDQILLMCPGEGTETEGRVQDALDGQGYTTNQTDAWVCLEVSGPDTLRALERICPINLALAAFPVGASARTAMEHLGALIIRLGEDRFLLCSASSSAPSFAHSVTVSFENVV
ncbi:MAG: sarcosine oxidase subunit gamma [Pseudomonadota bacterium]